MWIVIDIAMDNSETYRVVRPCGEADGEAHVISELMGLICEGKILMIERDDNSADGPRVVLAAPHISRIAWEVLQEMPPNDAGVRWRPMGAPMQ